MDRITRNWILWAKASRDRALTENHPAAFKYAAYLERAIAQKESEASHR